MKRKNLNVVEKVKHKILPIKNSKIKKIYTIFRNKILENIGKKDFALGVSGGPDSLCLAYMSKIFESEFKNKTYTLIVNHRIRNESASEALNVKNILKKKGIESIILTPKIQKPIKNIQLRARELRYGLVYDFCLKKNINYFVTAHHQDDQVENFFIRLFRGSGLTGLSSMAENSKYKNNLKIIRPFLNVKKKELQNITSNYFKKFIKDPSNENEKFLRTRIRRYRKNLEREGLNTDKVIKTVNNLLVAKNAVDFYKQKALQNNVNFLSKSKCIIHPNLFSEEANEVIFKSVSDVLSLISGSYYPPRSRKILNLIKNLKNKKSKKCTLGGCIIEKKDGFTFITKEKQSKIKHLALIR